jgi:hypothetical protein
MRDPVLGMIVGDELTGVMLRLGLPDRQIRNACVHTTCPEYKSHLCSLAYPPPNNGRWSDCVFRQRFRKYAGSTSATSQVDTGSYDLNHLICA